MSEHIAEILKNDLGVKESYQHAPKRVTPGESIETNGAVLLLASSPRSYFLYSR